MREAYSSNERGFLLVALPPLLLLALTILWGLMSVANSAYRSVALQSRIDACAVRLALKRETTLSRLASTNRMLEASVAALYVARGARLAGPASAILGGISEAGLLRINIGLAARQDALAASAQAFEINKTKCPADSFSKEPAMCSVNPALLTALARQPTLFPDIKGALKLKVRGVFLAKAQCWSERRVTTLGIRGDPFLTKTKYEDEYLQ